MAIPLRPPRPIPKPRPRPKATDTTLLIQRIDEMMKRRIPGTGAVVLEDTRDLSALDSLPALPGSGRSSQRYVTWM